MTGDSLLPTGSALPERFVRFAAVVILLVATTLCASAQPNVWEPIDFKLRSGFATDKESPTYLFFADTLHGFLHTTYAGSNFVYETRDGGLSWLARFSAPKAPYTVLGGGAAISTEGFISEDDMKTWRELELAFNDPELDNSMIIGMTGASARQLAARLSCSVGYYDSTLGQERTASFERLGYTLDGGTTWSVGDSVIVRKTDSGWVPSLYHLSPFGELPAPQEMSDPQYGWLRVVSMPDTSTLLAISYAKGMINGKRAVRYYMGSLNLQTKSAEWTLLPMWTDFDPYTIDVSISEMQTPAPGVLYANDVEFRKYDPNSSPTYLYYKGFWRSEDYGRTWSQDTTPEWLDIKRVRFVSADYGVTINGVTKDGGKSWQPVGIPFRSWQLDVQSQTVSYEKFYAVDSTHYFYANTSSLFARSTDGGKSWQRNNAGYGAFTLAARRGCLVVGRNYRGLLLSNDAGVTWRDIGQEGGLPGDLSNIVALTFPDTVATPNRILGVGMFIANDNEQSIAMIESIDGGLHWNKKEKFPIADSLLFKVYYGALSRFFFFAHSADRARSRGFITVETYLQRFLLVSDDGGSTWKQQDTVPANMRKLSMSDPDNGILTFYDGHVLDQTRFTTDGGKSWQELPGAPHGDPHAFGNGEFRILGGSYDNTSGTLTVRVYRSTDRGHTWDTLHHVTGKTLPDGGITSWLDTARFYTFTTSEAWLTLNGGDSYSKVTTGLNWGENPIYAWGHDDAYFYFISQQNGAGRIRIGAGVSSVPFVRDNERLSATILANPARGEAIVRYSIEQESDVQVNLYDLLGRAVRGSSEHQPAGTHEARLDLRGLPAGHYTVQVQSGAGSASTPLVVLP